MRWIGSLMSGTAAPEAKRPARGAAAAVTQLESRY